MKWEILVLLYFFLSGCSIHEKKGQKYPWNTSNETTAEVESSEELANEDDTAKPSFKEILSRMEEEILASSDGQPFSSVDNSTAENKMPADFNKLVKKWVHYFAIQKRDQLSIFLRKGQKYQKLIQDILLENDLPPELYYLAMIESGFSTHARSSAKAVGIWQFIAGTGTRYGLDINPYVDERRDPIRATEAAARYLRDLYTAFQNWHLALAAYNAGEHRILSAVIKGSTRDYWSLVERKLLPRETQEYVPKFLAAVLVSNNLEKFGFSPPEYEEYPELELTSVPSPIRLKNVAHSLKISESELKRFNPHILKGVTPPHNSQYEIWVPTNLSSTLNDLAPVLSAQVIKKSHLRSRYSPPASGGEGNYYTLQKGDNLISLAKKFHITVSYLMRLNNMKNHRLVAGEKLRIRSKSYHPNAKGQAKAQVQVYVVKKGDSLIEIARQFSTTVKRLKYFNKLRNYLIYAGQKLRIPPLAGQSSARDSA